MFHCLLAVLALSQTASAQATDTSELYDAFMVPGTVEIRAESGEFESWSLLSDEFTSNPGSELFRWKPSGTYTDEAQWQLSATEQDLLESGDDRTLLASGPVDVPSRGLKEQFSVPVGDHMADLPPDNGADYYLRVVAVDAAGAPTQALTNSVLLDYHPVVPADLHIDFWPEVSELHPEMYDSSPMEVEINIDALYVGNDNEVADEPYVMLWVIYVDGTTIDPLAMGSASARILTPSSLHGNIPDHDASGDDLDDGHTAVVPSSTGHFLTTIEPIGLDLVAGIDDPDDQIGPAILEHTRVYVLAVAMEEDASSTSSVQAGFDAATDALQDEIDSILQSLSLASLGGAGVSFSPEEIQQRVTAEAMAAAQDDVMSGPWFLPPVFPTLIGQVVDPDDYIGWGLVDFGYGQLLAAGTGGIDFSISMSNVSDWEGSYTLKGTIHRN